MEKKHIMEQFASLAQLDIDEAWEYSALGDAAIRQVNQLLKNGVDADVSALEYLCAALCFYRFTLFDAGGEESIRAADISVVKKHGDRSSRARQIRDDAFIQAKDFLKDDSFIFKRTES